MKRSRLFTISILIMMLALFVTACGELTSVEDSQATTQSQRANDARFQDQYVSYPASNLNLQAQVDATPTPLPDDILVDARSIDAVFINIYERYNGSVVNIEVVDENSPTDQFSASGSGFVFDNEGHIVTNAHVVRDSREIIVTFSDGFVADAELIGLDDFSDLAVIKVDVPPSRLNPIPLGDSSSVRVGQSVVAIGNPFGLTGSMTIGSVSATGRALPSEQLINFDRNAGGVFNNPSIIQVDAIINPGNSGGPVINLDGEVVGVASAIRTETGIFQGVAFAVPANTLNRIAPQLIANGEATYPYLGISSPDSSNGVNVASIADEYNLPVSAGVIVAGVQPGSPADDAGLLGGDQDEIIRGQRVSLGGDIIVAVDDVPVNDLDQLLGYLVENISPGDEIILTIVRGDQTFEVPVIAGERPR